MNILNELTVKNLKRNKKRTLNLRNYPFGSAGYGDYDICFQHAGLYDRVRKEK